MASREKKLSLGRKQTSASPVPPKEIVASSETSTKSPAVKSDSPLTDEAPKLAPIKPVTPRATVAKNATKNAVPISKKLAKTVSKRVIKKKLTINLKAKAKTTNKINKKLVKVLLSNTKSNLKDKKTLLLKNGVKPKRIRKTKAQKLIENQNKLEPDDKPPVLEPILPINIDKKQPKKRIKKSPPTIVQEESKKIKVETEDSTAVDTISAAINSVVSKYTDETKPKKVRIRKAKIEPQTETIEDAINDLSLAISKSDDTIREVDTLFDAGKTEIIKTKKVNPKKQQRIDVLLKKATKKENIENALSKNIVIDSSARHIIDMLDLNVRKIKNAGPICRRRHSIEKFPISALENTDSTNISAFTVFSNLPRSITPKSKRVSKVRQSIDTVSLKRSSPYTTRSDSPARILRNGKHRKLKDNLLDGLDSEYKKRKRLCSDFSGSEKSVSKLSGYESDSSFSDLASLHGAENPDQKDLDLLPKPDMLKKEPMDIVGLSTQDLQNVKPVTKFAPIIKRSLSTDTAPNGIADESIKSEHNFMDTNSNLCNEVKTEISGAPENMSPLSNASSHGIKTPVKAEHDSSDNISGSPSAKVPEKSIILDIMKQTFNDINPDDQEKRTTRSSTKKPKDMDEASPHDSPVSTATFYGVSEDKQAEEIKSESKQDEIEAEELPAVNDTKQPPPQSPTPSTEPDPSKETEMEVVEELKKPDNEPVVTETTSDLMESKEEEVEQVQTEIPPEVIPTISDTDISDTKDTNDEEIVKVEVEESPENLAIKENILQALGLRSLKAAEEEKKKEKEKVVTKNDYTGTLKTVIKLNRCEKKKGRNSLKITLQKTKIKREGDSDLVGFEEDNKMMREGSTTSWRAQAAQSSDTAGALRKSHYSNRSNMDGSSEHTSDGDVAATEGEDSGKVLVIPEKASSFSIHPGRLCKDECSYCFGKFGLFDTPCHIAQMKSIDRQNRILATEKHLTRDSCLCDACYRHVDRKSNTPSYSNKISKRCNIVAPGPRQNHCHVLGCGTIATNILRRKWIIKMRKSICKMINIDLNNPGLHSIPICDEHYSALEHLMICAMCKRRLARNHIHYLGPETNDLNAALNAEGIPVTLLDKPVVCKLCRYFATLILKPVEERPENSTDFFKEYKKRLLHFHDVELMDQAAAEEPIPVPTKDKHDQIRKKKKRSHNDPPVLEPQVDIEKNESSRVPSESTSTSKSRSESPSDYMVDYNTLVPSIALECGSDIEISRRDAPMTKSILLKKIPRPESVKEAVEISKNLKFKNTSNNRSVSAVQRLGSNPSISVRQLFPGEEELGLQANIDFNNVKERTPEGWEKCTSTIQYDNDTKHLWHELQKPYGNQSSFLRHLILLEKYFRSGDLVLGPTASHHSINYSESVQNRLRAYDNIPMSAASTQPSVTIRKSSSGIITTKDLTPNFTVINAANIPKSTPITISQISNLAPNAAAKQRNPGVPPGLISLHPGTTRPVAPLVKVQQPQKIKIPLTKNWRPNLIPIDPSRKAEVEKKPGYVKVISGGKPYHITLEDYNRMCAIKKSYDLKQKRLHESAQGSSTKTQANQNSVLKSIIPQKGLIITKAATVTHPKVEPLVTDANETDNSLEKLDKTVEKLESKLAESKTVMILPKIPRSLTVIPQTVTRKPSRPSSPVLMITTKPKAPANKS